MANEKNFIDGMRYSLPREKAPSWIKGQISVNVAKFIDYAQNHADPRGWLNIDIKESKNGNVYLELNTWSKSKTTSQGEGYGQVGPYLGDPVVQDDDEVPF